MADNIIGIDLGTTNSEVAALVQGQVQVLASDGEQIMPSVVGLSPDGRLLVGTPARNQYVLYPERTVRSMVVFQKWRWTEINVTLGLIFVVSLRKEWPNDVHRGPLPSLSK